MPKMQIIFMKSENNEVYETSAILAARVLEYENSSPKCIIELPIEIYDTIKKYDKCEIFYFDKLFFVGQITSFFFEGSKLEVEFETDSYKNDNSQTEALDIITKFRNENPDLIVSMNKIQITRNGEKREESMLCPKDLPIDITNEIFHGSLKINESKHNKISQVSLEILASWVS
ncbi:MAG: hypothetical protein LBF70_02220, partial [Holosporales bacterium]|nr:hypothetical protein [Holosporales bacterium]